jgi:ribosomal protein S18 acetylase RimI-like enzyme
VEARTRLALPQDLSEVRKIAVGSGLFDEEGVTLIEDRFRTEGSAIWILAETEETIGVVYGDVEPLTDQTWNALMLIVAPEAQSKGVGHLLMDAFERAIRDREARILLVETSSDENFEVARTFYKKLGFREESRFEAYYADGHDKITFWKRM